LVELFGLGFGGGGAEDGGCGGEILEGDTGRSGGTFCEGWFEDVEGEERHLLALVCWIERVKLLVIRRTKFRRDRCLTQKFLKELRSSYNLFSFSINHVWKEILWYDLLQTKTELRGP
jgi:hypothetical protein